MVVSHCATYTGGVFSFQPLTQVLQLHSSNLHCVVVIYIYIIQAFCICFVDLTNTYDSVSREILTAVLRKYGFPEHEATLLKQLYVETCHQVKMEEVYEQCEVRTGCMEDVS